jgi:transaldolase/glucose-6-phosphate isomerase
MAEERSVLRRLSAVGQSVWYDNIRRGLIDGELRALVAAGVRGVTSNPTIFEKAIGGSEDYDAAIAAYDPTASLGSLYDHLVVEDIRRAADVLRPVFDASDGADGYVSVEVAPHLAHDSAGTVAEALRLRALVDRPNVMIKVPATAAGVEAIRRLTALGVSVNVTLIFSLGHYERVIDAYLAGLEERLARGEPLAPIASVASFFVSRVDTAVDRLLAAIGGARAEALMGRVAVANAKVAYALFQERFASPRFATLRARGARVQRPLWASTGTKNPAYSDVLYVDSLVGPDTVNTMPPETLRAVLDHGRAEVRVTEDVEGARAVLAELGALGIDLDAVTETLQVEGVRAFAASFDQVMRELRHKRGRLVGGVVEGRYSLGVVEAEVAGRVADLQAQAAVRRLWARDAGLYGIDPASAASVAGACGWLDAPRRMLGELAAFEALARQARADGYTDAVVLGMGGSSLCPDVLRHTFAGGEGALRLFVLDTTHPDAVLAVRRAVDPARTLFLVSSKSGTTTEPNAFYRYFRAEVEALAPAGGAGARFVAITDPGTPLERLARAEGFRAVIAGLEDVGGRYSALTPFGLVPAALIGVDVRALVGRGLRMLSDSGPEVAVDDNPGARLGATLGAAALAGRDKVTIVAEGQVATFGDWVEQLLAESTGKQGRGLVPVVGEPLGDVDTYGDDRLFVAVSVGPLSEPTSRRLNALEAAGHPVVRFELRDALDLGGEFARWEVATAIAGAVLAVNPFDQPNVQESKDNTTAALAAFRARGRLDEPSPYRRDGAVTVAVSGQPRGDDLAAVLERFLAGVRPGAYVAFMAYAPPSAAAEAAIARARAAVRRARRVATTFGYGPRFLHSTGQLHKGGPADAAFVQIVVRGAGDAPIPDFGLGFDTLVRAQALGDLRALEERGRRLVRLELDDSAAFDAVAAAFETAARAVALTAPEAVGGD